MNGPYLTILLALPMTLGLVSAACGPPAEPTAPAAAVPSSASSSGATPAARPADGADAAGRHGGNEGARSDGKPGREPPSSPAPVTTTGAPPPESGDYTITYADCSNLVANFERRLREDEMAKLEAQKLQGKAHETALEVVEDVVRAGVDNWRGQCHSIVGSVQVRSHIRCAIAADSRARFDACWNGEVSGP